jgi:hypothetical protein
MATSLACSSATLLLPTEGNWEVQDWGGLQWQMFCQNFMTTGHLVQKLKVGDCTIISWAYFSSIWKESRLRLYERKITVCARIWMHCMHKYDYVNKWADAPWDTERYILVWCYMAKVEKHVCYVATTKFHMVFELITAEPQWTMYCHICCTYLRMDTIFIYL